MYYIFFIHFSTDGYSGYFHVLGIVNSAALNISLHISFQIMIFSGYTPRSGIFRSYGCSIFIFKGNSILFSTVTIPVYIPNNSLGGFTSLHPLSSISCIFFFIYFYCFDANYFTILQWFLPYIDMDQPWIYMCSPSWISLSPSSPSHPSGHPGVPALHTCLMHPTWTGNLFHSW